MTASSAGAAVSPAPTSELPQETATPTKSEPKIMKETPKTREGGRGKAKAETKRAVLSGVPATITSAMAARKHHQAVVDTLDKGLEILDSIMDLLRHDAGKGELTSDLSHIAKDPAINDADIIGAMVAVIDERKKPSLEFVLGVLGATEVPTPLLERQRTQGQRSVMLAARNRAMQKRREAKREAAVARAAKAAAEKAAREKAAAEKAAAEKARAERAAKEAAERKEAERKAAEARKAEEERKAEEAKKAEAVRGAEKIKIMQDAASETSVKKGKGDFASENTPMAEKARSDDITKRLASVNAEANANKAELRKVEASKTVEIAKKAASAVSKVTDAKMGEASRMDVQNSNDITKVGKKEAMKDTSSGEKPSETRKHSESDKPKLESKSTKLRRKADSTETEPKKSRFSNLSTLKSSKPATAKPSESSKPVNAKHSSSSGDTPTSKQKDNTKAVAVGDKLRKKSKNNAAKLDKSSHPAVTEVVLEDSNDLEDEASTKKDAQEAENDDSVDSNESDEKPDVDPKEKESPDLAQKQDSDSGEDAEVFQRTVRKSKAASSRTAEKDKRLGRKRTVRSTPSPSPSPLPRLTKPPKNTVGDDDMEDSSSDDSDFVDGNLGPSLLSSGKHDGSDKINSKSARSKDSDAAKEARRNRKNRFHQYRTEKGRFTSKQNASGTKPRKNVPKVVETSEEESESEEEITPVRPPTKQTGTAKHKASGRIRKQKGVEVSNSAKASPVQDDEKPKRRASDKNIDLSAYQRTPREQRMSGRRAQVDEPGEAAQKIGRLRRESSNLNHDNTEMQLWERNPYMGMCYRAWEKINNFAIAIPFREPVRADDAPGYFDVIKRPMDLRTVRNRVMSGALTTPSEFQRDMNQIVRNALTYNSKASDIYDVTLLFREKMRKEVDPIVEAWKALDSGKGGVVSEKVAEVQRQAKAGPRSSARYPSRRSSWKPPTERSPSPSPTVKKGRGRGRKRVGFERADTVESEEERAPPSTSKRSTGSGRGRGRGRKSKGSDRASAKEKEKSKSKDKDKHSEKDKDRGQSSSSHTRTSKRSSKNLAISEDEPSSKRRRVGSRKYRDD